MKNMYLYMGIGIAIAAGLSYASGIYTVGYAEPETVQVFMTKSLYFCLSLFTYIINTSYSNS